MSNRTPVARAVVWGAGWNTAGTLAAATFNFVAILIVTRSLGVEGYARYSYLLWLASIGALLASVGLARPVARYVARARGNGQLDRIRPLVQRSCLLVAVLGLVLGPALAVTAQHYHPGIGAVPAVLLTVFIVSGAVSSIQAAGLQGGMGFRGLAIASVASASTLCTSTVIVALNRGGATEQFTAATLAAAVLALLQGLLVARLLAARALPAASVEPTRNESSEFQAYWLRAAGLLLVEAIVWQRPEVLFLATFASAEELGYYNAAWALASRLVLLATLAGPVLQAQVAGMSSGSEGQRMQALYFHGTRWLCLLAIPVFLLSAGLAAPVVRALYGPAYEPASVALAVLSLGGLVACASVAGSAIVFGTDKIGFALRWGVLAALGTLLLDFLLIPRLGSIGAAIASVGGQTIAVSATMALALAPSGYRFPWNTSFRALAAGVLATCTAGFVAAYLPGGVGLLAAFATGLSTYSFAILVSGALKPEDWVLVNALAPGLPRRSVHLQAVLTWALGPAPGDRP